MTLEINAFWDDEVAVWVATSDDVPGLITEAATMESLIERLQIIIPELMELNGGQTLFRRDSVRSGSLAAPDFC